MGNTPRAFNRFFLALVGIALLAAGAGLAVLALFPRAGQWWDRQVLPQEEPIRNFIGSYTVALGDQETSLVTLGIFLLLVLALIFLLWLMFAQRSRRESDVTRLGSNDGRGYTTVSHRFVKEALTEALEQNPDVLGVRVTSLDLKKQAGILVKLQVRQGAQLARLKADSQQIVRELDQVLGQELPLIIQLTGGLKASWGKSEQRVD